MTRENFVPNSDGIVKQMLEVNSWLESATFMGQTDDQRVTVWVRSTGRLARIELDPRLFRPPSDAEGTGHAIVLASDRACEAAAHGTQQALREVLGADFTMQAADGIAGEGLKGLGQQIQDRLTGESQ